MPSVLSRVTDENGSWVGEARGYANAYTNPVVIGQVMTENDPDWSVFWASDGSRNNPPDAGALFVVKNVGEDPDATRANETLGYMVFEAGGAQAGELSVSSLGRSRSSNSTTRTRNAPRCSDAMGPMASTWCRTTWSWRPSARRP